MVYENHRVIGGCQWCTKTTEGQVGDGVQEPPLGWWAMVYENRREMGGRWCTETTVGGRWCTKTAVGRVGDGVQEPPLGRWAMVYENRRETGGRWCMKTTIGWVGNGVQKPL